MLDQGKGKRDRHGALHVQPCTGLLELFDRGRLNAGFIRHRLRVKLLSLLPPKKQSMSRRTRHN